MHTIVLDYPDQFNENAFKRIRGNFEFEPKQFTVFAITEFARPLTGFGFCLDCGHFERRVTVTATIIQPSPR